jgi:hypothetical protein
MCPSPEPDQKTASPAPFTALLFLVRRLGIDPLSWVVGKTEDPLRESRIPGRNVGELTLL